MELKYLSLFRLPTAKAHGLQVMKTCQNFADLGLDVELITPSKKNFLKVDPFSYYGIKKNFSIRRLMAPDFLGRTGKMSSLMFALDFAAFAFAVIFGGVKSKSNVIYYTRDYPLLFLFFPRPNQSLVAEIHDIPSHVKIFQAALNKATHIVVITQGLKNKLIEMGVQEQRITVAPDGVDLEDFGTKFDRNSARTRLGLNQDSFVVMYAGKLGGWKGTNTLLEASKLLPKGITTVVIGGDPSEVMLLKKKYPEVVFVGFLPYRELPENQKAADVLVVPNSAKNEISKHYTSPLKVFAHMASGVPIVASDLPSLKEILSPRNSFFFTPDNPRNLADVILGVKGNKEEALRRASAALHDVERYTWKIRANSILDFIARQSKSSLN